MSNPFELSESERAALAFASGLNLDLAWHRFRTALCVGAVKLHRGNRNKAAAFLGVHRNTLARWVGSQVPHQNEVKRRGQRIVRGDDLSDG